MTSPLDSSLLDALNAVQHDALQALVSGQSISAAANSRRRPPLRLPSGVHNWTRHHPDFARALLNARHSRAERMLDELGDLADLAIDTFRQLLSDENAPASVRLKAAMEIAKLVEAQRPPLREATLTEVKCAPTECDQVAKTAQPAPKRPCPCGSALKYKRAAGIPSPKARAA